MNKKIFFALFILNISYFILHPPLANAASFKFSPAAATFNQNCTSSVDVILDTENEVSNSADIKINYDQTKVDIIQVKGGNVYTNYFGNVVDPNSGTIKLTGATFDNTFNGHGVFATIIFKPKVSTGNSSFDIYFTGANQYNSLDSNIANALTSNDLLSSVQNGSYTFSQGACTADTTPPTIKFITPVNGQIGVPADANIVVDVNDSGSGVNINSVTITINGIKYTPNSPNVTFTGNPNSYHFVIKPTLPLYPNSANTVAVNAADLAGNSRQSSIIFNIPTITTNVCITPTPTSTIPTPSTVTTPPSSNFTPTPTPTPDITDTQSPQIIFINPISKQTISLTPQIKINLTDSGTGIDLNTLQITLGDQTISYGTPGVKSVGSKYNFNISYPIKTALKPDTDYVLTVFVSDYSGNSVSQSITIHTTTPLSYRFAGLIRSTPTVFPYLLFILPIALLIIYLLYLLSSLIHRYDTPYGQVIDTTTLEPIPNYKVSAINLKTNKIVHTQTNIFGIFSFKLDPGQYQFFIKDCKSETFTISKESDIFIDLPVTPTTAPHDDRTWPILIVTGLRLPPHGFLFNSTNHLQSGKTINLIDTKTKFIIATRITNSIGQYRFFIPHGRYLVSVKDNPHADFIVDTRHLTNGYTTINQNIFL